MDKSFYRELFWQKSFQKNIMRKFYNVKNPINQFLKLLE